METLTTPTKCILNPKNVKKRRINASGEVKMDISICTDYTLSAPTLFCHIDYLGVVLCASQDEYRFYLADIVLLLVLIFKCIFMDPLFGIISDLSRRTEPDDRRLV